MAGNQGALASKHAIAPATRGLRTATRHNRKYGRGMIPDRAGGQQRRLGRRLSGAPRALRGSGQRAHGRVGAPRHPGARRRRRAPGVCGTAAAGAAPARRHPEGDRRGPRHDQHAPVLAHGPGVAGARQAWPRPGKEGKAHDGAVRGQRHVDHDGRRARHARGIKWRRRSPLCAGASWRCAPGRETGRFCP